MLASAASHGVNIKESEPKLKITIGQTGGHLLKEPSVDRHSWRLKKWKPCKQVTGQHEISFCLFFINNYSMRKSGESQSRQKSHFNPAVHIKSSSVEVCLFFSFLFPLFFWKQEHVWKLPWCIEESGN